MRCRLGSGVFAPLLLYAVLWGASSLQSSVQGSEDMERRLNSTEDNKPTKRALSEMPLELLPLDRNHRP